MKKGKVFLVGAGAGDIGLLSVKGRKIIENADVVVYDMLANPSILNYIKSGCELIFAGKQSGHHFKKQYETNLMLVTLAEQGKNVVRLKGGDPFIFGRGGEEAQILKEHGIEFEIVSGISSCYSVPAYAGIPVTHRDYASSFHVITGHKRAGIDTPEYDYSVLAKQEGTLIFLMSLANLSYISKLLIENGKDKNTPVAVIQQGTTSRQKVAVSTLEHIAEEVRKQDIKTPALTVIGDAVKLRDELKWFEKGELFGRKILITGTPEYTEKMSSELEKYGADAVQISLIMTTKPNISRLEKIDFKSFTWIVFTSSNGVRMFFDSIGNSNIDLRNLLHLKFAVIGSGTAEELKKKGISADCIPEKYESRYLAETLIPVLSDNDKVLIMRAENGTTVLSEMLEKAGKNFKAFSLYKTKSDIKKRELLNLNVHDADYIIFASSSAVRAYAEMADNIQDINAKYISIGDVTSRTAENLGIKISRTAEKSTVGGIIQVILESEKER